MHVVSNLFPHILFGADEQNISLTKRSLPFLEGVDEFLEDGNVCAVFGVGSNDFGLWILL